MLEESGDVADQTAATLKLRAQNEPNDTKSHHVATAGRDASRSVAIVLRFKRTLDRNAKVIGLFLGQFRELHADFFQV